MRIIFSVLLVHMFVVEADKTCRHQFFFSFFVMGSDFESRGNFVTLVVVVVDT